MPQTFNQDYGNLPNLDGCRRMEFDGNLGAGAGGTVYRFRYYGHPDPKIDAMIRPFVFHYVASDGTVFDYLGVKVSTEALSEQEALNAAYLSKPYVDASVNNRKVPEPTFNLSGPAIATFQNRTSMVIMTKIEVADVEEVLDAKRKVVGLKFTGGSLEDYLDKGQANVGSRRAATPRKRGFQSALENDLAITIGQLYGSLSKSHYQLISQRRMIHADLALRNALLSDVDNPDLKKVPHQNRIPTKFAARINDFGISEVAENIYEGVVVESDVMPLVYCDFDRIMGRHVTAASDFYAKRIVFFEALARLERNSALFNHMVSPDGGPRTYLQVAQFVARSGSNENALRQYIRNSKNIVRSEEGQIFLSSFERYLVPESKTLKEMTIEEDRALQQDCFNDYFEKLLSQKLSSLNTEHPTPESMHAFLISLHRLLELDVSEAYKNSPVYKEVRKITQAFPLTNDYERNPENANHLMSKFVTDCKELKSFLVSNQHKLLVGNVNSTVSDYEVQSTIAHNLMERDIEQDPESLTASDFNLINQQLDHWQDHPDQTSDLQKKIEQLKHEITALSNLLVEEADKTAPHALHRRSAQLYMRQLEIINKDLIEAEKKLKTLEEKSTADVDMWKNLVEKRKVVFQMEQERILQEIAEKKEQYTKAITNLSQDTEQLHNISLVELGKTLAILLSIEKSIYEYQRLGKYVSDAAPDIHALFKVPLLNKLRENSSYKALFDAFDMERRRNAPKPPQEQHPEPAEPQVRTEPPQTNAHRAQQQSSHYAPLGSQSEQVTATPADVRETQNTPYSPVRVQGTQDSATPTDSRETQNTPYSPVRVQDNQVSATPTDVRETQNTPYSPVRVQGTQDSATPAIDSSVPQSTHYAPVGAQQNQGSATPAIDSSVPQSTHYAPVGAQQNQGSATPAIDSNVPQSTHYAPLGAQQNQDSSVVSDANTLPLAIDVPQQTIAEAAAEYVAAMNQLASIGISSLETMNVELKFADYAKDSNNHTLMSIAIMNLGETSLIMRAIIEARENYRKLTGKSMVITDDALAAAALKGVYADPTKIHAIVQIPDCAQRLNNIIGSIIVQSGEASKMKEKNKPKVIMPAAVSSVNAEGFKVALEEIYKKETTFIAQMRYLHDYFYDKQGHLKNNDQLGMNLTPQERYTLEHLLSPYQKIFADLPQRLTRPALDTVEERNDAAMEIISWRVKKADYFDQVKLSAENSPTLSAMLDKLPDRVKPTLQAAITAPENHAKSMSTEVSTLFEHVKDSTSGANSKLKALLIYLQNKNQKVVDAVKTSAKNKTTGTAEDIFEDHKEDIKAQQREKIKTLKERCCQHTETILDKAMAKQVNTVLGMLADYGIKQRTNKKGLLKVKKVQELLTDMLALSTAEDLLKYIDKKLKTDTDLYEHKAHSGDTQLVRFLHELQRKLGKTDVPAPRSKQIAVGGTNLLKSQQKADAEIRKLVTGLADTTKNLSMLLDLAALPPNEREEVKRRAAAKSEMTLFRPPKRRDSDTSLPPEITPTNPGNLH